METCERNPTADFLFFVFLRSPLCDDNYITIMGCMHGNTLKRSEEQIRNGVSNLMHPELNSHKSEAIPGRETKELRAMLPAALPEKGKMQFSGKSFRKGVMSELAMAEGADVFRVSHRSGHHVGTNLESHPDSDFLVDDLIFLPMYHKS